MSGHLVVIFAYHFPPEEVIGGARPFRFAKYLSRIGYKCRVFTAAEQPDGDQHLVVSILDPFLASPRRGLGWRFERMIRKFLIPGDLALEWSYRASHAANAYIRANPANKITILSTFPPLGAHLAAWQLAHGKKYRWIVDFRDPMRNALVEWGISGLQRKADRWLEQALLKRADVVIANTDGAMARLQSEYPLFASKIQLIWNGFDPEERIQALPIPFYDRRTLVHVGELYMGRTATPILESIARLIAARRILASRVRVLLIGIAEPEMLPKKQFLDRAREEGWLEIRNGQIPKSEALEIAESSNGLLLLQPQSAIQVPGKLFEYLQIGRPILALIPPNSACERLLAQSGVPYRCVYPGSTIGAIDETVAEFLSLPSAVISASPWFEEQFNTEKQTQQLDAVIRSLHDVGTPDKEKTRPFNIKPRAVVRETGPEEGLKKGQAGSNNHQ